MISAGHRQRHGLSRAVAFGQFTRGGHLVRSPGDDNLAGTIQVGQLDPGLGTDLARLRFVESDDGGHCSVRLVAGFLHEAPALTHDLDGVLEAQRAGGGQGGELAEGQSGRGVEFQ